MPPKVTTQFGDKKFSIWITKEQLEALKKATGKDSAYSALKVAVMAGYEHIMKCSTGVESYDKLVKEIEEMPLSRLEKRSKKLRLYGSYDVQNLNEELVHYACSGSAYTLDELVNIILLWAGESLKQPI